MPTSRMKLVTLSRASPSANFVPLRTTLEVTPEGADCLNSLANAQSFVWTVMVMTRRVKPAPRKEASVSAELLQLHLRALQRRANLAVCQTAHPSSYYQPTKTINRRLLTRFACFDFSLTGCPLAASPAKVCNRVTLAWAVSTETIIKPMHSMLRLPAIRQLWSWHHSRWHISPSLAHREFARR